MNGQNRFRSKQLTFIPPYYFFVSVTLPLGFHQNRVVGFPRLTRQELATSRRKVRACEPLSASIMFPSFSLPHGGGILHRGQMERKRDERSRNVYAARAGLSIKKFSLASGGDENRCQLFALLSQRCELFHLESICRNGVYDATLGTWRRKQFIPMSGWVMCI